MTHCDIYGCEAAGTETITVGRTPAYDAAVCARHAREVRGVGMSTREYWRAQIARIVAGCDCRAADDLVLYTVESQATAEDTLRRGARAAGDEPQVVMAGHIPALAPGVPALVVASTAGWCALCAVTSDGRLATIDDVAVWES